MAMIFVARNFAMIVEMDLRAKLPDILIQRGRGSLLSFFATRSLEVIHCPKLGARSTFYSAIRHVLVSRERRGPSAKV